jgi:hypothetical protein
LLLYVREFGSERMLTALNLGTASTTVRFSTGFKGTIVVSTSGEHGSDFIDATVRLDANEGFVVALAPDVEVPSVR